MERKTDRGVLQEETVNNIAAVNNIEWFWVTGHLLRKDIIKADSEKALQQGDQKSRHKINLQEKATLFMQALCERKI